MKKTILDIAKLIALIILAVSIMMFIGSDMLVCSSAGSSCGQSCSSESPAGIADIVPDELTLGEGEQLMLEFSIPDGEQAVWTSSNEEVVSCLDGIITTHQAGESVIMLSSGVYSDYVRVTVSKTVFADAAALIGQLASDGAPLDELYSMQGRLDYCTGTDNDTIRELIGLLAECAGDSASYDRLTAAAEAAGLDVQTVLDAASFCWAAGEQSRHAAVISFTGDVTIGMCNERGSGYYFPAVYSAQESLTYPFDRVRRFFLSDDLTIVNFEGVLTESRDYADKAFYFRGEPSYAGILAASGIEAATLANNHAMDYFRVGYDDTVKHLTDAGVSTFDEDQPAEYTITTDDGRSIRVVMFAYNLIGNARSLPDDDSLELIAEYKTHPDTVVVISAHWGSEYNQRANADQNSFGRALIDAGADIVVGHHPHIIQGIECYNGKYIAYSLGNFSFSGNTEARYPQTFILQANVDYVDGRATVSGISVIPCYTTSSGSIINNYQPCVQYGEKSADIMALLLRRSGYTKYGADELHWSGM